MIVWGVGANCTGIPYHFKGLIMAKQISQEYLKELFNYNPDVGVLFRKKARSNRSKEGTEAGWTNNTADGKSYRRVSIDRKEYAVHRLIFVYMTGEFPPESVDHINGNGLDNRWSNLRAVTQVENMKNIRKRVDNNSGFTGVTLYKRDKTWEARIKVDEIYKFLGRFKTIEEAVNARKLAEIEYGFHENHGTQRNL